MPGDNDLNGFKSEKLIADYYEGDE